jgi:hypothetical protein
MFIIQSAYNIFTNFYQFNSAILAFLLLPVISFLIITMNFQLSVILSENTLSYTGTILKYRAIHELIGMHNQNERYASVLFEGFILAHITHCHKPHCPIKDYFTKKQTLSSILLDANRKWKLVNDFVFAMYSNSLSSCSQYEKHSLTILIGQALIQNNAKTLYFVKLLSKLQGKVGTYHKYLIYKSMYHNKQMGLDGHA